MKKYTHLINLIVVLFLLAVGLFAGHFFLFRDIKNKNQNISKLTNYLNSEIDREDYVISSQRLLQSLNSDIQLVKDSIVSNKDADGVEFIENLEEMAHQDNLDINISNIAREAVDPKSASSTSEFLKVSAKVNGTWSSVYKFVSKLESMPYKVKINSLILSKYSETTTVGEKTVSKDFWEGTFEIRALKYK